MPGIRPVGLLQVGAQLVAGAGPAGVVARDEDPAAGQAAGILQAVVVVALPAMQRDGDAAQPVQGLLGIDAEVGVVLLGQGIAFFHVSRRSWRPFSIREGMG